MPAKRFLFCFLVLCAGAYAQPPQFTIQDLGTLPNLPACTASGLSQSGNVTGYCLASAVPNLLGNPITHGFLYSKGAMMDLGLTAQSTPVPMAVNDSGVVTGAYLSVAGPTFTATPFVIQQDGSVTLPQGQMQDVLPFALNNAGQLAGTLLQASPGAVNLFVNNSAVLYSVSSGATTILDTGAAALGINSSGTVAGALFSADGTEAAPLLWQDGKRLYPEDPGGFFQQYAATSVNDVGGAAGLAFNINLTRPMDSLADAYAMVFNNTGLYAYGAEIGGVAADGGGIATSINNSDWIVGFSTTDLPDFTLQLHAILYAPESTYGAFLYADGKVYDLNTLLTNATGWHLAYATAINNAGQIAGTGIFQGPNGVEQHAFLLTPTAALPGPSITGVEGAGLSVPAVTSISANGLFTIFGNYFALSPAGVLYDPAFILNNNNELPTNLSGTCVESGNTKWGLFYASPGQINALAGEVPSAGTVPVSVISNCGTPYEVASPVMNVPAAAEAPEFLYFVQNANGQDPVAAVDFTTGIDVGTPGPPTSFIGATFAPVQAGDVVIAYGVGWGATTSTDPIGKLASGIARLTNPYSLTLGGIPVTVSYAGLSPGSAGLYQINFSVPSGLTSGNLPLVLTVNGVSSPPAAYITVTN
jgi:uncharacterized protein (TIGR03437 family)